MGANDNQAMPTPSTFDVILLVLAAVLLASTVTFLVLFVVAQRRLAGTRDALEQARRDHRPPESRRRRRRGVAPVAIKSVLQAADLVIAKGLSTVQSSIDDLAGWARIERPDLARVTGADGRVVLVFSDIEGSTELNATMGDRAWVQLLERHNALVQARVDAHGGHVVKTQGDGFMIAFADPERAVRFGADVQHALDGRQWETIRVRMGIHLGTSVRRGADLFGLDVATAARVADQAAGGEILVSEPVREAVAAQRDIAWGEPRHVDLKGVPGTHALYPLCDPA
jgi:adenylate cyclase